MTRNATLDRLRRANPISQPPAGDSGDRFSRITALPRERPKGRRLPRRVLVLAAAALGALAVTSAAIAISGLLGGVEGPATAEQEYIAAQSQLVLPPGDTWPQRQWPRNSVTSLGAGGGVAVAVAQVDWECYWASAIKGKDTSAAARARTALEAMLEHNVVVAPAGASENWSPPDTTKPIEVYADDGGYQYAQHTYAEAAAGDPSGIAKSCRANG
jgi:hypothetical protein